MPDTIPNRVVGSNGEPPLAHVGDITVSDNSGFEGFSATDYGQPQVDIQADDEDFQIYAWKFEWTSLTPADHQPFVGREGNGGWDVWIRGPTFPGTIVMRYREEGGPQRMAEDVTGPAPVLGVQFWLVMQIDLRPSTHPDYVGGSLWIGESVTTGTQPTINKTIVTAGTGDPHLLEAGHQLGRSPVELSGAVADSIRILEFRVYDADGDTFEIDATKFADILDGSDDYEDNIVLWYTGSAAVVIQSIDETTVADVGGEEVTLTGLFDQEATFVVSIRDGTVDEPCYSGVVGQGYTVQSADGATLAIVTPPVPPGVYDIHVIDGDSNEATLEDALTVIEATHVQSAIDLARAAAPPRSAGPTTTPDV